MSDTTHGLIDVVAAVVERRGRWLLAQRPPHKAHGGLWEFPGGKVNTSESLQQALKRELSEELALQRLEVAQVLASFDDQRQNLRLHFVRAFTDDAPVVLEHSALGWFRREEALGLALAPLDRRFLLQNSEVELAAKP